MSTTIHFIRPLVLILLVLTSFTRSLLAEEVSIPDPGLNAAIREALQKPNGPLSATIHFSLFQTSLPLARKRAKYLPDAPVAQMDRATAF